MVFLPSRLLFTWMTPVFRRGWAKHGLREPMTFDDFTEFVSDETAVSHLVAYERLVPPSFSRGCLAEDEGTTSRSRATPSTSQPLAERGLPKGSQPTSAAQRHSLLRTLVGLYMRDLLCGAGFRLVQCVCLTSGPFILRELVVWLEGCALYGTDEALEPRAVGAHSGFLLACALGAANLIMGLADNYGLSISDGSLLRMRSTCVMAIYAKVLRLHAAALQATGRVQQLHDVDVTKFLEIPQYLQTIWSAPVLLIAAVVSMSFFVGWPSVLTLPVVFIGLLAQMFIATRIIQARAESLVHSDERLTMVNEVCQGIRVVKLMGWELPTMAAIALVRDKEIQCIRQVLSRQGALLATIVFYPMLIPLVVFGTSFALGRTLAPTNIFPALAMLNVLRVPLTQFPLAVGRALDLALALDRIGEFLATPERQSYMDALTEEELQLGYDLVLEHAVVALTSISTASTVGGDTTAVVGPLSLQVPAHKLTCVVGPTGCGKSILLDAMAGQAALRSGRVAIAGGSTMAPALMSQDAWIMNGTVRDNIAFGLPFDEGRYNAAVKACQLLPDFELLPSGDWTEIGERGINLSGGQKQRIAFARAVYSNRSVVLMDDPLSAVDPQVAVALFEGCIAGALAGRTRVLVTHQKQFLAEADSLVVLSDGCVVFQGSYEEYLGSNFASPTVAPFERRGYGEASASGSGSFSLEASQVYSSTRPIQAADSSSQSGLASQGGNNNASSLIVEEAVGVGRISLATIRWYLSHQHVGMVIAAVVAFCVTRAAATICDLLLSWWASRSPIAGGIFDGDGATDDEVQYIQWYGILVAITGALCILQTTPFNAAVARGSKGVHADMLNAVMHAPMSYFDTTPVGRIVSRFGKDINLIDVQLPWQAGSTLYMLLVVLGTLAIIGYASAYLLIPIAVTLTGFVLLVRYFAATNFAAKRLEAACRARLPATMSETLSGIATIRSYQATQLFHDKHAARADDAARGIRIGLSLRKWLTARTTCCSSALVLVTAVVLCGVMVSLQRTAAAVSALPIMALALASTSMFSVFLELITTLIAEFDIVLNCLERAKEYCCHIPVEDTVTYGGDDVQSVGTHVSTDPVASHDAVCPRPDDAWPRFGRVEFHNVSLRYRPALPLVLRNASFTVAPGARVGVVGRTGSGKSSLFLALFRMVPQLASGWIALDGRDIATVKLRDLRQRISMIPQDPLLFQGTVRSNLDPFGEHPDATLWDAVRRVGLMERVEAHGAGLACPVAQRGANFSVGQRQLLCLARALIKRCRVLLLDEATASVDGETDLTVQAILREAFVGCTVLTIAHRLQTVVDSDYVLVLSDGVVIEYGPPHALLTATSSPTGNSASHATFAQMAQSLGPEAYHALLKAAAEPCSGAR